MRFVTNWLRVLMVTGFACTLSGCQAPAVYGSIGYSSYGGYGGFGTSVSIGGRIY